METCWQCFGKMDDPRCYHMDTGRTVPFAVIVQNLLRGSLRWIRRSS